MPIRSTGSPELDAIVARHIRYYQTRRMEVLLSCLMVAVGISLVLPGNTFDLPSFRVVAHLLGEDPSGWSAIGIGCLRLWAIQRNGRRHMPVMRLAGSALGFFYWLGWAGGFALTAPPFVPLDTMAVVLAVFEIYACALVTRDAYADISLWRRERARTNAVP